MVVVFLKTATGRIVKCFTWRGSAETGIARAMREAGQFGFDPKTCEFWAETVG